MRFYFTAYLASLGLAFSSSLQHASADSIRGTRTEENSIDSRYLISEHRRLLPLEGVMRTLIIRVTDSEGKEPMTDARRQSDTWFGTHGLQLAENLNSLVRSLLLKLYLLALYLHVLTNLILHC